MIILPHCYIQENPRAGTRSLCAAVMDTFYPDLAKEIRANCADETWAIRTFKFTVPKTDTPEKGKDILLLVRDPMEKFISCAATFGIDKALELIGSDDEHFKPQSDFIYTHAYRFPDQLEAFQKHAKLPSMPIVGVSFEKPILAEEHLKIVRKAYAKDIELYESLKS